MHFIFDTLLAERFMSYFSLSFHSNPTFFYLYTVWLAGTSILIGWPSICFVWLLGICCATLEPNPVCHIAAVCVYNVNIASVRHLAD